VIRRNTIPQNYLSFSFPVRVTVSNRTQVRSVARALCALPVMPKGTYSCPADFGIAYQLVFSAPGLTIGPISAEPGGCEVVRGVGTTVRWVAHSRFWPTLGTAMGLIQPSLKTFAGELGPGNNHETDARWRVPPLGREKCRRVPSLVRGPTYRPPSMGMARRTSAPPAATPNPNA
jgi:hypothetical protein